MAPESEVVSVSEALDKNKHPYKRITFADHPDYSYPVFDKKILEGVAPGVQVFYEAQKNERGFLNLTELRPLAAKVHEDGAPESQTVKTPERQNNREGGERNHAIFSANALNGSLSLFHDLLEKDIVKPQDGKTAVEMVKIFYRELMKLHEPKV